MKEPNREPAIGAGELHTIEHLAATFLRNHPQWGDQIVFWGPMGCCTGNYFLVKGDLEARDIVELMRETFRFIRDFEGRCPVLLPGIAGIFFYIICPWLNMRQRSIYGKCWMSSTKKI